jgi:thiol-disulfide isomerase/thioredoxin
MDLVDQGINYVKKICQDDEVCVMLVFVLVGFMLCYLFKNQISGYMNFATVDHEFYPLIGPPVVKKAHPAQKQQPQPQGQEIPVDKVRNVKKGPKMQQKQMKPQGPIGIELKPRKPDPTPSTERQLGVMAAKPPVMRDGVQQAAGLMVQDATIFKPFDEVWNPGFMPLDMVFKGVPSKMGADRPMPPTQPVPPTHPTPQAKPPMKPKPRAAPTGSGEVSLVLVYAPWCGYSKQMLPDYERIKSEFDGKTINGKKINIIMYNSDVDKDKVKEYDVNGFPSLFFESDGKRESFPHREYDKIKAFLEGSPMPSVAPPPTKPQPKAAPATGSGEVNLVLVYAPWCGYSKKMLPDYEKIKAEFDGKPINGKKINIIMYNSDVDKDKVKEYQVEGFPTLFLERNGNREPFPHREYDKIKSALESL